MSQKRIILDKVQGTHERSPVFYRVKKLVNIPLLGTFFRIGDKLTEERVTGLCDDAAWTVTIIDGSI